MNESSGDGLDVEFEAKRETDLKLGVKVGGWRSGRVGRAGGAEQEKGGRTPHLEAKVH